MSLKHLRGPGFWYLATPYTLYPEGQEAAFIGACRIAADLIAFKVNVFSPIAHSHSIGVHGDLDLLDLSIWIPTFEPMIRAAEGLLICTMPTWEKSKGIAIEIDAFRRAEKPIRMLDPKTLEISDLVTAIAA